MCGFYFLDLGVVDPWCNASYLHSHRNGENHCAGILFTSLLNFSFSYAFDPDRITLLEQGKSNSGLRSWPGHLNSPINSFFGGLDDFYFLRKEWLESSANCWYQNLGNNEKGLSTIMPQGRQYLPMWGIMDPNQSKGRTSVHPFLDSDKSFW